MAELMAEASILHEKQVIQNEAAVMEMKEKPELEPTTTLHLMISVKLNSINNKHCNSKKPEAVPHQRRDRPQK